MADAKASAVFEVRAQGTEKASRQFTQFERTTTQAMSGAEASVARSLGRMAAQYLSLGVGINKAMKLMSSGIDFNKFVENQTMSFTVMMKSADKAKGMMQELYDFAVKSPLTFKDTASSAKQLMAYGFQAKELVPTMDRLGSVAIATGHSLGDIAYVYGTLRSQGRAYSRDLMQFGMRGIPIYEELAKVMGVASSQIQKMASEGKIGFKEVEQAFINMTSGTGRFSGIIEGYMETLTGKLSMLSDIWEKSSGSLMKGVFDVMKQGVEELTTLIESKDFQNTIADIADDLKALASVIKNVMMLVLKNLPTIIAFLKVLLISKAFSIMGRGIQSAISGINLLANGMLNFGGILEGGIVKSSMSNLSTNLGNLKAGFSLMADAAIRSISLILSPLGLLTIGVIAVVAALKLQNDEWERNAQLAKQSSEDTVRMAQFMKDFSSSEEKAHGSLWQYMKNIVGLNKELTSVDASQVESLAKEYNLTEDAVANALIYQGLLTRETWKTYEAAKAINDLNAPGIITSEDYLRATKYSSTLDAIGVTIDEYARDALKVQGLWDVLADFDMGKESARNIGFTTAASFGEPDLDYKKFKVTESLPSMNIINEMIKAGASQTVMDAEAEKILKQQYDLLLGYLNALIQRDMANPDDQNPALKKWLAEQLKLVEDQMGKKGKKIPGIERWWLPDDSAVARSLSSIDGVRVAGEKAIYNAQKEVDARRDIMQQNLAVAKTEADKVEWQRLLNVLAAEELQIRNDITEAQNRALGVAKFEEQTNGMSGFYSNVQANAAAGFSQGGVAGNVQGAVGTIANSQSGTEVGKMAAGANPFAMASAGMGSFLGELENVQGVLDPFATIFEAMGSILEPLINNALEPLMMILTQIGEVIGEVLSPFVALIQIVTSVIYLALAPLIAILQLVGAAFTWLFDYVIAPVGNAIIFIVNAIIRVLNMIPGVHIKYLKYITRSTKALEDFSAAAKNSKDALNDTISYLQDKLEEIYDKQLDSMQELYEVGALSATAYEEQVAHLNAMMVDTDDALVSYADKQLSTQEEILTRLLELYQLQNTIETSALTDKEIANLLESHGLTTDSQTAMIIYAIKTALTALGIGAETVDTSTLEQGAALREQASSVLEGLDYKDFMSGGGGGGASFMAAYKKAKERQHAVENALKQVQALVDSGKVAEALALYQQTKEQYGKYVSFAVGTAQVPTDMTANIHKDEGIIPASFMDSIRRGDLVLSGTNQGNGQTVVVNVTVQGSVTTEKDLANSLSKIMYQQRSRGILTV